MSVLVRYGYVDIQSAIIYSVSRFSSAVTRGLATDGPNYIYEITSLDYNKIINVPIIISGVEWGSDEHAGVRQTPINLIVEKASEEEIRYPHLLKNIRCTHSKFLREIYRHPLENYPETKHRCNITPDSVVNFIRECLADGEVKSWFVGSSGEYAPIDAAYWASFRANLIFGEKDPYYSRVYNEQERGVVLVKKSEIEKIWDDWDASYNNKEKVSEKNEQVEILSKSRPGAPDKYDKTLFLAEAFKYMWFVEKGVPADIAKLARAATAGYIEAGGLNAPPSDKWAWNMASDLWKRMGFKGGEKAPD